MQLLGSPEVGKAIVVDVEESVRRYVSEVVTNCSVDAVTNIRRFREGERHAVYRVTYLGGGVMEDVIVRIAVSADDAEVTQAEREAAVLRAVGGTGAPVLIDFQIRGRFFEVPTMCLQFVEGDQRPLTECGTSDLEALGRAVASVHGLPVEPLRDPLGDPGTTAGYLDSRLRVSARRMSFVRDPLPTEVQRRVQRVWLRVNDRSEEVRTLQASSAMAESRLMHGDISGGNVIWSPAPVLIDWEFARLGDPADEIASMFGQHELSKPQRHAFWRGYEHEVNPRHLVGFRERVIAWEPVTLFGSALWWLERWTRRIDADITGKVDAETPHEQLHYGDDTLRRLDTVERLLDPPERSA